MSTLTWYGHATWLLTSGKTRIVIDPFFNGNTHCPVKAEDVAADYIMVTHGHFDHTGDLVALAKKTGANVVCNWEISTWLEKQGVTNLTAMNTGGSVKLPFGQVKSTIAHHSSSLPDGTYGGNPNGYVVSLENKKIYFAGDTALFMDMQLYGRGGLDYAVLPIGDLYTMGIEDSIEAIKLLQPKYALPSHFDTWPPIEQDTAAWAARVKAETKAIPVVPKVGVAVELG